MTLAILSVTSTAYAQPKADPVEVLPGGCEIFTELEDPQPIRFYAWSVHKGLRYNRVRFSDESEGYILSDDRLYIWAPVNGPQELLHSPGDWLRAVIDYQRERYGQEIDGAPVPLRNGKDFSWDCLGVNDYIEAWEDVYNVL